jgi:hypothetical protein
MRKYIFILSLLISGCTSFQNSAKYELADGNYKLLTNNNYKHDYYIENKLDTIFIYNTLNKSFTNLPEKKDIDIPVPHHFVKSSFDVDILTALFKIRPQIQTVLPIQLNSNFNGNIYLGRRKDIYKIEYKINSLNKHQRQVNHFGFSGGVFLGLGNTNMNSSTTNNMVTKEYDGLIFQKGISGIIAINKLSVGLSIGFDNLLDENNKYWIYQNKMWYGLMFGLNLN